jgi:hypothetical protein
MMMRFSLTKQEGFGYLDMEKCAICKGVGVSFFLSLFSPFALSHTHTQTPHAIKAVEEIFVLGSIE